ncbi:predicted protein [Histoplasma capsulatum var. duboisii H88]|uniref:Predicted protein n=1 Tax=Ajellomyces capsulatus (strain H88) TaxID=544711 RepID=F0UL23_AJEC8|nr:predicted protein [Histoplasma capsulatum var. duboisii H88]
MSRGASKSCLACSQSAWVQAHRPFILITPVVFDNQFREALTQASVWRGGIFDSHSYVLCMYTVQYPTCTFTNEADRADHRLWREKKACHAKQGIRSRSSILALYLHLKLFYLCPAATPALAAVAPICCSTVWVSPHTRNGYCCFICVKFFKKRERGSPSKLAISRNASFDSFPGFYRQSRLWLHTDSPNFIHKRIRSLMI